MKTQLGEWNKMKEIYRFSEDKKEQKLFSDILNKGKRTSHNPILWNGCGRFENQIIYNGNVYEHTLSFGQDRILQIEVEDLDIIHKDPETPYARDTFKPYISDKVRKLVLEMNE